MPKRAPLDYAALSENERATVEMLYYIEFSVCDRPMLVCSARELKRLIRQGWIESTPEQVDAPHYDRGASCHPAAYWITGAGREAMQQAEQQARITFWLKQKRTAKILCFPLVVEYPARKEVRDGTHAR